MKKNFFSIVTAVLNGEKYIEETSVQFIFRDIIFVLFSDEFTTLVLKL
jgi:hypothetical protein